MFVRSLEMDLKEIRMQEDGMLAGQRGSRMSKWIQSSAELRKKAGLDAPDQFQKLWLKHAEILF